MFLQDNGIYSSDPTSVSQLLSITLQQLKCVQNPATQRTTIACYDPYQPQRYVGAGRDRVRKFQPLNSRERILLPPYLTSFRTNALFSLGICVADGTFSGTRDPPTSRAFALRNVITEPFSALGHNAVAFSPKATSLPR